MRRREFLLTPAAALAQPPGRNDWVAARPRLYFTREAAERARRHADWPKLIEQAKHLLESRLIGQDIAQRGGGQHANYGAPGGQISQMGLTLGLAYHATGEKPYAEKLRDAMLHYAGF